LADRFQDFFELGYGPGDGLADMGDLVRNDVGFDKFAAGDGNFESCFGAAINSVFVSGVFTRKTFDFEFCLC